MNIAKIGLGVLLLAGCRSSGGKPAADGGGLVSDAGASCADGKLWYDAAHGITWLTDADLPASETFGLATCDGSGSNTVCVNKLGAMGWKSAVAWIAAMNAASYLGHSDWQLPTTPMTDASCGKTGPQNNSFGFGCTASAFAATYGGTLGLAAPNTAVPLPSTTSGPFVGFQPYLYWSKTSMSTKGYATFSFDSGFSGANTEYNFLYVLPMIAGPLPGTTPASGTSLQPSTDGKTVYDPIANVTWLADANIGASNTFTLPRCTSPTTPTLCVATDGAMTWAAADQLIKNMNAASYLGQTTWTMPTADASCNPGYGCSGAANPMGALYYAQLRLVAGQPVVSAPDISVGPFSNLRPYLYWSCLGDRIAGTCSGSDPAPNFEWSFSFGNGFTGTDLFQNDLYVTAYFVGNGC